MARRNPEESLLLEFAAAERGEPLDVSEDDLRARFAAIVRKAHAERGWSENMRGECRRIAVVLDAIAERR